MVIASLRRRQSTKKAIPQDFVVNKGSVQQSKKNAHFHMSPNTWAMTNIVRLHTFFIDGQLTGTKYICRL